MGSAGSNTPGNLHLWIVPNCKRATNKHECTSAHIARLARLMARQVNSTDKDWGAAQRLLWHMRWHAEISAPDYCPDRHSRCRAGVMPGCSLRHEAASMTVRWLSPLSAIWRSFTRIVPPATDQGSWPEPIGCRTYVPSWPNKSRCLLRHVWARSTQKSHLMPVAGLF